MKYTCLITLLLAVSSQLFAQDSLLVDKIAAVVGDKIILYSDIEIQHSQYAAQGAVPDDLRCTLLDQLMLEKLLLTHAELDSVVVAENEIETELDNRFRYYINLLGSEEAFEEYFKKSVVEFKEDFREDVRSLLLAQRKQGEIIQNIKVTPAEVKQFFASIPQDSLPYFNSEVKLAQILIKPKVNEEERQIALDRIKDVRKKIVDGTETFEELASIYSEDPGSAKNGGDLGFMSRGELVQEFEAAAFKLQKDEISDIVESDFGFHVIQLLERRGNKIHCRHILIKPRITFTDEAEAKQQLDTIKMKIENGTYDFKDAVSRFSEDEQSKAVGGMLTNPNTGTNYFQTDELDPDVYFAIEGLTAVNEITDPVIIRYPDGSIGYRIIQLISQTPPHQANLKDDYNRISEFTLQQKQNAEMEKWVKSRAKRTYINIDEDFDVCPIVEKWAGS